MYFVDFKELVSTFSDHCFEKGFKSNGYNLRLNRFNNVAVINFQKSKDNIPNGYKFTINIGIHYRALFFFNTCQSIKKPVINDCQWKVRIGFLLSFKSDYWWTVDKKTDFKTLEKNLNEIFDAIINPTLVSLISDDGYINNLAAKTATGTSEIERLKNLSSLFCINEDARLDDVLSQLMEYCRVNKLSDMYEKKAAQIAVWKQKPENGTWSFADDFYKWI
jgi:hypothetical protein